ncbi:hypothetical protein FA13DRAFT_1733057 [Coprinellus micaceus]|uniref:Uncharacterized protein n=1 Tax=Coprinellus micaceus TaxID=71717 RepID=A0A4Y7TAC1_COPMI|nr:hypothetical protein FA13DRAFT_1733057 [Coprinellus micaceus]
MPMGGETYHRRLEMAPHTEFRHVPRSPSQLLSAPPPLLPETRLFTSFTSVGVEVRVIEVRRYDGTQSSRPWMRGAQERGP